jgi:hypothetical protein
VSCLAALQNIFLKLIGNFLKKPNYKATNPTIVDNVLLTKTNCLEQNNAGHFANFANEVDWSLDLLVTSLCSGRSRLFKQCVILPSFMSHHGDEFE